MKIKPEYTLCYEEGDISIMRLRPDGTEEFIAPLSESAAIAWEQLRHGASREAIVDAVVNEFQGADPAAVAADLDALMRSLVDLGFAVE